MLSVNKNDLPQETRGKIKGDLTREFLAAGFADKTQVLLLKHSNAEDKTIANLTTFEQVPPAARYKGRGNRISGKGRHGLFHVFDIS